MKTMKNLLLDIKTSTIRDHCVAVIVVALPVRYWALGQVIFSFFKPMAA